MDIPIAFATGTQAQATAAEGQYQDGQVSLTTADSKRMRVGLPDGTSHLIGWPKAEDAVGALSTAGTTNLVVTSGYAHHTCVVTITAGGGAFTRKLVLPLNESGAVAVLDGTYYEVLIVLPASANPTIEVWNETALSGTAKFTLPNAEAEAREVLARFHRTGGVWRFWGATILGS